jgi:fibronectin type 3 domain-containing protein
VWIYRRAPTSVYGRPLTPVPLPGPSHEDKVAAGERWCYVVRTVSSTDPVVESASSGEVCLDVKDVTAPAAPTGVAALVRDATTDVSWSPSPEADLGGYRVYRQVQGGAKTRLAEVAAGETVYTDKALPIGVVAVYSITAFDKAGNESAPSAPAEVVRP